MPPKAEEGVFFRDAGGQETFVPQSQIQQAQAQGLELIPGQKVTFTSPVTGQTTTVSGEDFLSFQALEPSARIADQATVRAIEDEAILERTYGGLGGEFTAGALGVARGATLGLSDVVLAGVGVDREDLQGYAAANPRATLAGELTGAVAPGLLSGGTGTLGAVSRATLAGKATQKAVQLQKGIGGLKGALVGGAVEGALFGAGQGVSNLVLQNEPLTAEAMFNEIGMNAVFGGALGAGFGVAGEALFKGGQKLYQKALDAEAEALEASALKSSIPALDPKTEVGKAFQKSLKGNVKEINKISKQVSKNLDSVSPYHGGNAKNYTDAISNQLSIAEEHAQMLQMKAAVPALRKAKAARNKIYDFYKKNDAWLEGRGPKWNNLTVATNKQVDELQEMFIEFAEATKDASRIAGVGDEIAGLTTLPHVVRDIPDEAVFAQAKQALAKVRDAEEAFMNHVGHKANPLDLLKKEPEEAIAGFKAYDDYVTELKKASDILEGAEGSAVSKQLQGIQDDLKASIQQALGKTDDAAEVTTLPELAEMAAIFGLEEAMIPDMPGPADELVKMYFAYKLINKMKGKGGAKVGRPKQGKVGKAVKQAAVRSGQRAAQRLGKPGTGIVGTAVSQVKFTLGGQAAEAIYDTMTGGMQRMGAATGRTLDRMRKGMARGVSGAGKAVRRSSPVTSKVLRDVRFSGEEERETKKKQSAQEAFKQRSAELNAAIANLPAFQQHVHNKLAPVRQVSLGVGDKMAGHAVRTAQFLHAKMPKDPGLLKEFGVSKWRPTAAQLDKWARYINAAQDPAGVVERFGNGHMSREDAETLRALYPAHFAEVQMWIADNLPTIQEKMPYRQRIQTSVLMGTEADPTMSRVDVWQQSFLEAPPQPPQQSMNVQTNQQPTAAQQLSGVRSDV